MLTAPRFPHSDASVYRSRGDWGDKTVYDLLVAKAAEHPEREAFADAVKRLSYGQLLERVERCATFFREAGIQKGDVVTIQLPNQVEFVVAFFALELIGAIANQINPDFRSSEVEYILRFSGSKAYICAKEVRGFAYLPMVREVATRLDRLKLICVDEVADTDVVSMANLDRYERMPAAARVRMTADEICRMAFTSGTTGNPKCALHSFNTTLYAAHILNEDMRVTDEDVLLIYLPIGLNWGYLTLVQAIMAGARAFLMEKFSSEGALHRIETEGATYIPTAPAAIVAMLNNTRIDSARLDSLRVIITGGSSAAVETIKAFQKRLPNAKLIELYGMLETGFHTYTRLDDDPFKVNGTIGRMVKGMGLRIVDAEGNDVARGEEGEIAARGPSVHLGYHNNESENAHCFFGDGWFRTGDLGRYVDDAGNVMIVGRRKEIINRGGKKYFPREVEEFLYAHPALLQVAIVGIPDARLGERNCLCAMLREGASVTLDEIVQFLKGKVADYKLPEELVVVNDMPMTATGKIKRLDLARMIAEARKAA
jgi:non-ribosomal peptide synthetase component E (peptide arylation enzyme)